nr:unnamed protein product [Callosobruchus analis]
MTKAAMGTSMLMGSTKKTLTSTDTRYTQSLANNARSASILTKRKSRIKRSMMTIMITKERDRRRKQIMKLLKGLRMPKPNLNSR